MILPRPAAGFEWRSTLAGPALVCLAVEDLAPHLFSTRHWTLGRGSPAQAGDGWREVATAMGVAPDRLVHVRQVHGDRAVVAPACDAQTPADIILSADRDHAIAVQSADCVPLLLVDLRLGAVAAVHAGWRGLAARVPDVAVRAMRQTWGSRVEDLMAAAGPSIGACCYEVGEDVHGAFVEGGFDSEQIGRWFGHGPARVPGNPPMPGRSLANLPGHWFFDGWASTHDQLLAAGLSGSRIFLANLCTASHPASLCSYRRDGSPAGRLSAAIRAGTPSP